MNNKFGDMSADERQTMVADIGMLLNKYSLPAEVKIIQECIYNMQETTGENNVSCVVKKEMPTSLKANIDAFMVEVTSLIGGKEGITINLACTVTAGMKYSTIENITNIDSDEKISLPHDGKAWLIDFWATWCPPCQQPMEHNNSMMSSMEARDDFNKQVRIIGLSIDKDRQTVVSHVKAKGWQFVEHYHRSTSNCSDVYGVKGVPHIILVDTQGTIVYKGHPASRTDLQADLKKLRQGKNLEGAGIVELQEPSDSGEAPEIKTEEGFTEMDSDQINGEMSLFMDTCAGWQQESEVQEAAKGMMRSYCVVVLQTSYNPQNEKYFYKYENHRVLVGAQEKIDTLQAKFRTLDDSFTFKVNNQIQTR